MDELFCKSLIKEKNIILPYHHYNSWCYNHTSEKVFFHILLILTKKTQKKGLYLKYLLLALITNI